MKDIKMKMLVGEDFEAVCGGIRPAVEKWKAVWRAVLKKTALQKIYELGLRN